MENIIKLFLDSKKQDCPFNISEEFNVPSYEFIHIDSQWTDDGLVRFQGYILPRIVYRNEFTSEIDEVKILYKPSVVPMDIIPFIKSYKITDILVIEHYKLICYTIYFR